LELWPSSSVAASVVAFPKPGLGAAVEDTGLKTPRTSPDVALGLRSSLFFAMYEEVEI
jgi:hypothetical protein